MYYVYVLQSERTRRRYIGSTGDIDERLRQHNAGMSRSTRPYRPWVLVYTEEFESRSTAVRRENQIKSWKNRVYLGALINSETKRTIPVTLDIRRDTIFRGPGL